MDALTDGLVIVDAQDIVRFVNAAVEHVLGRSREQLVGRSVWDAFPEALSLPFFAQYNRVQSERAPAHFETYFPPQDVWLEARLSPLADGGVIANIWDVSRRKRLEAELRASEQRFRATFEQAAIGLAHTTLDGQILRVNDRFCAFLGRTREELVGHAIRDFTHPEDFAAGLPYVQQLIKGERETYRSERRYGRPGGALVWGQLTLTLVRDAGGQPIYLVVAIEDISERKLLEDVLAARAGELQAIFDAITDGIWVYDVAGRVVEANAATRRYLPEDLATYGERPVEERIRGIQARPPYGTPPISDNWPVAQLLRGKTIAEDALVDTTVRLPDGKVVEISLGGAPIRDAAGWVTGAVAVARDVTERKRLERQRIDILRTVAHDLGNPLGALTLGLQSYDKLQQARERLHAQIEAPEESEGSAADEAEGSRLARLVEREAQLSTNIARVMELLNDAVARMQQLVSNLNTAIHLEKPDGLVLHHDRVDLTDACRREARLLQEFSKHEIVVDVPQAPAAIEGDVDAVRRVIANLLSNADKYSPIDRPVTLRLTLVTDGWARVAVIDQGPGIPEEERERIWGQFHRVPGIKAHDGASGLGLGLAICRGIIEQLGGRIGVDSTVGVGSTFWFVLPSPR